MHLRDPLHMLQTHENTVSMIKYGYKPLHMNMPASGGLQ
jgi:hypothetical protein